MKKATINMLGSCIIRDVFGLHENDGDYEIRQFLNFISPLTMFDKAVPVDEEGLRSFDAGKICKKWQIKCVFYDMTRRAYDYIRQQDSDWFITDAAPLRYDLVQFKGGELCCRSNNKLFNILERKHICPPIEKILSCDEMSFEEIRRRLEKYAEAVLRIYPPEKIILVEVKKVDLFYNPETGNIYQFEKLHGHRIQNKIMQFSFEVLCEAFRGCHIIRMPDYMMGNELHKWGKEPLHYTMEYYDYCLEACNIITANPDVDTKNVLEELRRKYSNINLNKYGDSTAMMEEFNKKLNRHRLRHFLKYAYYRFMTHVTSGRIRHSFFVRRRELWRVK